MHRLSTDAAVDLAERLAGVEWSWTVPDLDHVLAAAGLATAVPDPPDDIFIPIEQPDLPGVESYALIEPDADKVSELALTLAEVDDQSDPAAINEIHAAHSKYDAAFSARFGEAIERPKPTRAIWKVGYAALILRDLDIAVGLAIKRSDDQSERTGDFHVWHDLGSSLGTVLGTFRDLDFSSFSVGGPVVLTVSRAGNDMWLVASGPDNQVEPVALSSEQEQTLENAGFRPPLHEAAERGSQRDNWWMRVPLPARLEELKAVGDRMATALRDVYGAGHPAAIEWYGMDLSPETVEELDATGLTRSDQA